MLKMSIKGCTRQTIVIDGNNRSAFEKALFIVKDGKENDSKESLLAEAYRIVEERSFLRPFSGKIRKTRLVFLCLGFLSGTAATVAFFFLLRLF